MPQQETAALLRTKDVLRSAEEALGAIRQARRRDIAKRILRVKELRAWVLTGKGTDPRVQVLEPELQKLTRIVSLCRESLAVVPDGTMFVSDSDWMLLERTYAND